MYYGLCTTFYDKDEPKLLFNDDTAVQLFVNKKNGLRPCRNFGPIPTCLWCFDALLPADVLEKGGVHAQRGQQHHINLVRTTKEKKISLIML